MTFCTSKNRLNAIKHNSAIKEILCKHSSRLLLSVLHFSSCIVTGDVTGMVFLNSSYLIRTIIIRINLY